MKAFVLLTGMFILMQPQPIRGQIRFEKKGPVATLTSPAGLAAGDLNGDGIADMAAGSGVNGVYLILNDTGNTGNWILNKVDDRFGACLTVVITDMDHDGRNDLVAASWDSGEIAWYRNTGDPSSWIKNRIAAGYTQAHELFVTDLDRDGDPDVLCAGAGNNQIAWWRNDGGTPAAWTKQVLSDHFMGARSVEAADLDGDGDTDVAGASLNGHEVTLWINSGGTPISWTEKTLSSTFTGSHRVQIVDMNLDGRPDILATAYSANTIAWWENPGTATDAWTRHDVDNAFPGAVVGLANDFDLDGDPDIVGTAQPGNRVAWYENTGSAASPWKKTELETNFGGPWPVCLGDFDADGDTDFAVGGNSANEIRLYRNILEGKLTRQFETPTGSYKARLFIPAGLTQKTAAYLALPYSEDPVAAMRIRDMVTGLAELAGGIVIVPDFAHLGPPRYLPADSSRIEHLLSACLQILPVHPDSVYLIGFGPNGLESIRTGSVNPDRFRGIIPFNPLIPELDNEFGLTYPDIPVCLCSGSLHRDRNNHAVLVDRIRTNYGKARMQTLEGIAEEVLTGDLPEQLYDCRNYIDTVRGASSSARTLESAGHIRIFPNPGNGCFNIRITGGDRTEGFVELRTADGRLLWSEQLGPDDTTLRVEQPGIPGGLYFVTVIRGNLVNREKVLIL